ncbi:MAG: T9SS type A sorting domain-containing protein [Lewinellaceae bacterium]|nr:T9SS type A sorting domain-containing protein [Lewinellaceae bacterium]
MKRQLFFTILLFSGTFLHAQTPVELPLDIGKAIQEGSITVTHSPFDIGLLGHVFDDDPATLARSAAINPMVITLESPNPVQVNNTAILTSHGSGGWWALEAADNLADLNDQSGTYQLLVAQDAHLSDVWATFNTAFTARVIRLSVKRTQGDDYVHLNEWSLTAKQSIQATGLCFRPNGLRLLPGASFAMQVVLTDTADLAYALPDAPDWLSSDPGLFSVSDAGLVEAGLETGTAMLSVAWNGFSTAIPVKVVDDFELLTAETRVVKVALVIIDPPIAAAGGQRFSEHFWPHEGGPVYLAQAMADSLTAFSSGAVQYQIAQTYDSDSLFCTFGAVRLSADSIYKLFLEPGWTTLHYVAEQLGQSRFDYNAMLDFYDFCAQSDAKLIDEVWVYSMPFIGTWESTLTGEGAFWYNSPPLSGNACVDQLPIMGLNYERGRAEALHGYGHRAESAMAQVFGRWNYATPPLNSWEIFAQYDQLNAGQAHLGNIHFPPNGTSDYDYGNPAEVPSFAPNWKRYPFLFQETELVSCQTWNCDHLDYLSWWFRHFPHFRCKDQYNHLNNWWTYIVDYNEGKTLEMLTPGCDCDLFGDSAVLVLEPVRTFDVQAFPNPVVNRLQVALTAPVPVVLNARLFDIWGKLLVESRWKAGPETQFFELPVSQLPAGSYVLQLTAPGVQGQVLRVVKMRP